MSATGTVVAFVSEAGNLVAGDTNLACDHDGDGSAMENCADIFVLEPDPGDAAADLTGDGDVDDTVLYVVDTRRPEATGVAVAPADQVAVAAGTAAFLLPESALNTGGNARGADRNDDADASDRVVHLYTPRATEALQNLRIAATAVGLSQRWIAALVSEADQGRRDLNDDGDTTDTVVHIAPLSSPQAWQNLGQAGERLEVADSTVVFLTAEGAQGADLNGDGDRDDTVLQLYDADTGESLGPRGAAGDLPAAVDFVATPTLIAWRSPEAARDVGECDLNGDGDCHDDVLEVYDRRRRQRISSGQAVTPCQLEACDPRFPYRVHADTVTFLTLEADQGEDLNGDGDVTDLVLQMFNVPMAALVDGGSAAVHDARRPARTRQRHGRPHAGALTTVGALSAGICTDTGAGCAGSADCGGDARCYLPPGGCIRDLGLPCDPMSPDNDCAAGQFCAPTGAPGQGTCRVNDGPCTSDVQCARGARCFDAGETFQRLVGPLAAERSQVFVGAGRCVEDLGTACGAQVNNGACPAPQFCAPSAVATSTTTCHRGYGPCLRDEECPAGAVCRPELVVSAAPDSDLDEIPDPFDNCPMVANILQADGDGDGVGDACSAPPSATATQRVASPTPLPSPPPSPTALSYGGGGCRLAPGAESRPWLWLTAAGMLSRWFARRRTRSCT